jgi:hypothetical protein
VRSCGGNNPELTAGRRHTAVAALVRCWGLPSRRSQEELLARAAREIARAQRRNARARKGHVKRTRRRLRELGIKLTELKRCQWDTT